MAGLENGLDERGFPIDEGVYLARGVWGDDKPREVDVYFHPVKDLCCYHDDIGSEGSETNDEFDCHVSVERTGLKFIKMVRGLRD